MTDNYDLQTSETEISRIFRESGDIIVRIAGGEIKQWDTIDVRDAVSKYFEEIMGVSREAIVALKRNLDYNGYYIAHLLDQLSEEDFARICEKYSVSLSPDVTPDLYQKIKLLFGIAREQFSASDLSNIFRVEPCVAEVLLNQLKEEGLITDNTEEDESR